METPRAQAVVGAVIALLLLAVPSASAVDLQSQVRSLLQPKNLNQTQVAIVVMDMDDGSILVDINASKPMIPASNIKLLTTAAALDILGPDFVFRTRLGMVEPAQPGAKPALLIHGDGDPAFGDPVLLSIKHLTIDDLIDSWVDAVKETGTTHFEKIIVDDRIFDYRERVHPTWSKPDQSQHYGAQVAGLNFYRNCLDITPTPTRKGEAPQIEIYPHSPFLVTVNRAKTGAVDRFVIDRRLGSNDLTFRGVVLNRPTKPWQVTVDDPPMYFARLLIHRLAQAGIRVDRHERLPMEANAPDDRPLHLMQTDLPLILERTNRNSQNMFAEALLKRVAHKFTGTPGNWTNGAAAVRSFLRQRIGPRTSSVRLADGSGLSRDNRLTARILVELLYSMHRDPELAEIYRGSLAFAGRDIQGKYVATGTIARQHSFDQLQAGHLVFAKSGYLTGVSALSGYLFILEQGNQPARSFAFSMLFNGFDKSLRHIEIKAVQDSIIFLVDQAVSTPTQLVH